MASSSWESCIFFEPPGEDAGEKEVGEGYRTDVRKSSLLLYVGEKREGQGENPATVEAQQKAGASTPRPSLLLLLRGLLDFLYGLLDSLLELLLGSHSSSPPSIDPKICERVARFADSLKEESRGSTEPRLARTTKRKKKLLLLLLRGLLGGLLGSRLLRSLLLSSHHA
jgi:hypothetical protein